MKTEIKKFDRPCECGKSAAAWECEEGLIAFACDHCGNGEVLRPDLMDLIAPPDPVMSKLGDPNEAG